MRRLLLSTAFGSLLMLPGCGSDESADANDGGSSGGGSGGGSASADLGPAETMNQIASRAKEYDATIFWETLPASYQKDLNRVAQEFGYKMDEEIWTQAIAVVGQVRDLMRDRTEFILKHPMVAIAAQGMGITEEDATKYVQQAVKVFDDLLSSDLSTTQGLQDMDLGKFLAGPMNEIMALLKTAAEANPTALDAMKGQVRGLDSMLNFDAKLVSQDGSKAIITVPDPNDPGSTEEMEMVLIEGKWVPEEITRDWAGQIDMALVGIREMDLTEDKAEVLGMLGGVSGALKALNEAKNSLQFNLAVNQVLEQFGLGAGGEDPFGSITGDAPEDVEVLEEPPPDDDGE